MGVEMTDGDVIKDFADTVEVGHHRGPYRRPNRPYRFKPTYFWETTKPSDIFKVICDFYPYVGERRRAKFDEFLTTYGN